MRAVKAVEAAAVLFIGAAAGRCTEAPGEVSAAAEAEAAAESFDNNFLFAGKCFNLSSNELYYEVTQK